MIFERHTMAKRKSRPKDRITLADQNTYVAILGTLKCPSATVEALRISCDTILAKRCVLDTFVGE